MKRLLFIYNPQAGKGLIKPHLANVVDAFTKAGYLVTVWPTQGKEDATHVAARQGWWYDRVVCCGGDGTLSETVSGLLGRHRRQHRKTEKEHPFLCLAGCTACRASGTAQFGVFLPD